MLVSSTARWCFFGRHRPKKPTCLPSAYLAADGIIPGALIARSHRQSGDTVGMVLRCLIFFFGGGQTGADTQHEELRVGDVSQRCGQGLPHLIGNSLHFAASQARSRPLDQDFLMEIMTASVFPSAIWDLLLWCPIARPVRPPGKEVDEPHPSERKHSAHRKNLFGHAHDGRMVVV